MKKAREYFLKIREENLKENRFWINTLEKKAWSQTDVLDEKYVEIVKSIKTSEIKKAAQKWLKDANTIDMVMIPGE